MIEAEAISIARATAEKLSLPEGGTASAKRLIRLWPLPGRWQVIIQADQPKSLVKMVVNEVSGECFARSILYNSKHLPPE